MSVQEIDWADYGNLVNMLASAVAARHKSAEFSDIVAVSYGGMLPAAVIQHRIPQLRIHYWDVRRQPGIGVGAPRRDPVLRLCPTPFKGPRVTGAGILVVTDLVDEGKTSSLVVDSVEQYAQTELRMYTKDMQIVVACLCASEKHRCRSGLDGDLITASWKEDNHTVLFPYEQRH